MNKTLLAVFGHYDSRGGTTALPITANTPEEIARIKEVYNRDVFGYDPETDVSQYAGVGRAVDQMVDQLVRRGNTPADEDFLYVAELHHEGTLTSGDYGYGFNEEGWDVLIEMADDYRGSGSVDFDELKNRVVQLELVKIPEGFFDDIDKLDEIDEKYTQQRMDKENPPKEGATWLGRNIVHGSSSNDTNQIRWIRDSYNDRERIRDGMKTERLKRLTKVLKQPTQTRWDDDAWGFVVMID